MTWITLEPVAVSLLVPTFAWFCQGSMRIPECTAWIFSWETIKRRFLACLICIGVVYWVRLTSLCHFECPFRAFISPDIAVMHVLLNKPAGVKGARAFPFQPCQPGSTFLITRTIGVRMSFSSAFLMLLVIVDNYSPSILKCFAGRGWAIILLVSFPHHISFF